uniref:ATCSLD5 n=1 Tax=Arundo donax TaxID=35708 RepID=A0A0A9EDC7_ARUDO
MTARRRQGAHRWRRLQLPVVPIVVVYIARIQICVSVSS